LMFIAAPVFSAQIQACFSPPIPGGCDPLATVVENIDAARKSVFIQIYTLTSREIVTALVKAKRRGVDVRAIVDRGQLNEDRSDADAIGRLASGGVPILADTVPGLMHNKVMIVDSATVVTGSFNYTWSAEHRNAENLLVIRDPAVAADYMKNWNSRAQRARTLKISASVEPSPHRTSTNGVNTLPTGPVRGNSRSMIYQWPGCPYYDSISVRNRVEFPNARAAETAGYRPARNCP